MACSTQVGSGLVKDATTDEAADLIISAEETPHDHDHDHPPVAEEVLSPTKEADFDDDNQVIMHEEGQEDDDDDDDDDDAEEKYKLKEENTEEKAAAAPPITIGDEDEPTDQHTLNPDAEAEEDDDGDDMI